MAEYIVYVCDACGYEDRQDILYDDFDGFLENKSPLLEVSFATEEEPRQLCKTCYDKLIKIVTSHKKGE
jgi:RNase P subunit RPR2